MVLVIVRYDTDGLLMLAKWFLSLYRFLFSPRLVACLFFANLHVVRVEKEYLEWEK